jgi:hypothetical protein
MRALVVGAGATGTVFGAALIKGGASVTFYVREPHRARLAKGLALYHQGYFTLREEHIKDIQVATTPAEVAAQPWDQIWFTTPSDALRQPWLDEFLPATGGTTLVVLQPDPEDIQYIRDHGGKGNAIVQGLIQFSAWQSPMPHEPVNQNGITALLPPGPSALFDSQSVESQTIAATLTRGGLKAATRAELPAHAARMSATMIPLIAGLELAGWKLGRYAGHDVLRLALAASREAVNAECAQFNSRKPLGFSLMLNKPVTWSLLNLMPWVPGFDAESFLAYHFQKVDRQTRQMLETYSRHAAQNGLPHTALDELRGALPPPSH